MMTERRRFIATAGGVHAQQLDVGGNGASGNDFVVSVHARVTFAGICRVWGARGAATASVAAF